MKRLAAGSAQSYSTSAIPRLFLKSVSLAPALLVLFFSVLPSPSLAQEGCGELLKTRCETCHYLTRVCQKLEKEQGKGFFGSVFAGSWGRTIQNMVNQGAKLTEAEQEKLTKCLDNSSPEVLDVCGIKK